ncbi:MAG TPA: hypothetical protein VM802_24060 [Chitinophaga sp.]|uniref:hypothetical protein n=1 Tax=Chitinophaga sp. TaxID=1869181 RepID=UPI002D189A13|nr:hypothetical protein [Chitinophaga sp.]HVI47964.1 hypothetical protein [Chitinophaga sp.]
MRIIRFLFLLLITCQCAFATDTELAEIMSSLTPGQKTFFYQYAVLRTYAAPGEAERFWLQHAKETGNITREQGALLAQELLVNTNLEYAVKQPSRLQALRGVFTASRLLTGLAALAGAVAIVLLLKRYWDAILQALIRYFSPLFRRLFSPRMLTWELLLLSIVSIWLGPRIGDTVVRTIIIHAALFVGWAQLTAILTRRYQIHDYTNAVRYSLRHESKPLEAFLHVSVPDLLTTAAVAWLINACPDKWYPYELIIPLMTAIFTLPPLRTIEAPLSRILFPFSHYSIRAKDQRVAAYVVISLAAWVVMLLLPVQAAPTLLMLTGFLILAFLMLSIEDVTRCGIRNYSWMQILTVAFILGVILAGSQTGSLPVTWTGMGGLILYILIRYWELPKLMGWWKWKNREAWGLLGMALLVWGIALLIRHNPSWFIFTHQ